MTTSDSIRVTSPRPRWLPRVSAGNLSFATTVLVWIVLIIGGSIAFPGAFKLSTLVRFLRENAPLGIAGVGLTFVILTGGIDLSVGATIALSSVLLANLITTHNVSPLVAIPTVLLAGLLFGSAMGALIAWVGLPPFLVTLAGMFFARGLSYVINMVTVDIRHPIYDRIQDVEVFPVSAAVLVAAVLLGIYLARQTRFGRAVYAIGGNEQSALLMGVPVPWTKLRVYALGGLCSALAGVAYTLDLPKGDPNAAMMLELDAIAAVVIGGTALTGGIGGVLGTLAGTMILATIQQIVTLSSLTSWWTKIVTSSLLLMFILLQKFLQQRVRRGR